MATERTTCAGGGARPSALSQKPRKKSVTLTPRQREEAGEGQLDKHWRTYFLQALAETSNVTESAERAGVSTHRAYKVRREDAQFAAEWRGALLEGYDHLELEVLGYLRNPAPARKMDVAAAMRLLVMHRDAVARERALREDDDEQAVLDSIDAFIEDMRQRRIANSAILAEADGNDGAE